MMTSARTLNYARLECEILDALATKVRAFTHDQFVSSRWFRQAHSSETAAYRCIANLARRGLVTQEVRVIQPLLTLNGPVVRWTPGETGPDVHEVAWRLQSRWPNAPARPTTLYFSTRTANRLYGGPPDRKRIRTDHELHDLSMGTVYLHYLDSHPEIAARWIGEDLMPTSGFRLCDVDALVRSENGESELVIEFGGRYDARRVRHFHDDCANRGRGYELW